MTDAPASLSALCDDLTAETDALLALLRPLSDASWDTATPAEGWSIRDTASHLAFFDDRAVLAATDAAAFATSKEQLLASRDSDSAGLAQGRAMAPSEVLAWLIRERARLVAVFAPMNPKERIPWYGPAMSAASCVTARLMETWAHGQDVADALGAPPSNTDRLRHVAHIGVRARPFAYAIHGRPVPHEHVHVVLTGPNGDVWTWNDPVDGDPAANDPDANDPDANDPAVGEPATHVLRGPALDFCLVVTQRRHPADTQLVATGVLAEEWLGIAQSFAGPPGGGRTAGQFPHTTQR